MVAAQTTTPFVRVPDFFQLSAYKVCEEWKLRDWAYALGDRLRVDKYLKWVDSIDDEEFRGLCIADARSLAEDFLRHPELRSRPTVVDSKHPAFRNGIDRYSEPALRQCIRDQTVFEYFEGGFELESDEESVYSKWALSCRALLSAGADEVNDLHAPGMPGEIDGIEDVLEACNMPAWRMHFDAGNSLSTLFVAVDLYATDKELVRQFAAWLKTKRAALEKRKNINLPDELVLNNWVNRRYLPYLDLSLWARTFSRRISNKEMAMALYPGRHTHFGGSDMAKIVERTISKEACSLLDESFVNSLIFAGN